MIDYSGGGTYVGYDGKKNPTKTQAQIVDINSAVAKKINYIIPTEKNDNASMNLQGTRKMSGYDTANAKDSIIIRVSTISGYEVSGVDGGKAVAVKNADGTWTLTVPEAKKAKLKQINTSLESDLFYLLNSVNVRHNNAEQGGKNYIQFVADMKNGDIEQWYDDIYQMCLLAFLELDHLERKEPVKQLKDDIQKIGS